MSKHKDPAAYIAALEARVRELEKILRRMKANAKRRTTQATGYRQATADQCRWLAWALFDRMGAVRSYEVYDKIARDLTYWMRVELGMTRDVLSVRTVRRHLQKRPGGRVPEYLLETGLQRIDARRPEES